MAKKELTGHDQQPNERIQVKENIIESFSEINQNDTPKFPNQQLEQPEDIQAQLTLQQREAAMCLISFFGGYNNNLMDEAPIITIQAIGYVLWNIGYSSRNVQAYVKIYRC
ncbi:MAG: hypothetical protein K2I26_04485 [Paramuribaculum sp.]|nr:hypothetical protein [Paramuribaculum sp.]